MASAGIGFGWIDAPLLAGYWGKGVFALRIAQGSVSSRGGGYSLTYAFQVDLGDRFIECLHGVELVEHGNRGARSCGECHIQI